MMAKKKRLRPQVQGGSPSGGGGWKVPAMCFVLVLLTLAVFWNVRSASFLNMDDDVYVTENARVNTGVSWQNVKWAFSDNSLGFYFPLTLLSHMLDCQVYGTSSASGHHLTSLALHILSALLLFAALLRMTGLEWRSFMVAALFAVHPLHVESVAWVAERKDVLSAFFWFLSILAYSYYAEKPSAVRMALVFSTFLCGLLSKSMVITLPFVLLLLDYWPLDRWKPGAVRRLVLEKIPLFVLVPVFSLLTLSGQKGAMASVCLLPLGRRLVNALVSCSSYLKMAVVPANLSAYYPIPQKPFPLPVPLFCLLLLACVSAVLLWFGRRKGYLAVGWLWYLGTLVPVMGIVQVGLQLMADRYTYLPLTGIFIIVVWGTADLILGTLRSRGAAMAVSAILIISLAATARVQTGYWRDGKTLYQHALAVNGENWFVHNNLGVLLDLEGRKDEALPHYLKAVQLNPGSFDAQVNCGNALTQAGRLSEAIEHCRRALEYRPDSAEAMNALGVLMARADNRREAIDLLSRAVKVKPDCVDARNNLGNALSAEGRLDDAIAQYREALKIKPDSSQLMTNLALSYAKAGRNREAIEQFRASLRSSPDSFDAHLNLGVVLMRENSVREAVDEFKAALKIKPDSRSATADLGYAEKALDEAKEQGGH